MKAYLVRDAADKKIVGIFFAVDSDHLSGIIDEEREPGGCEYAILPAGGIQWGHLDEGMGTLTIDPRREALDTDDIQADPLAKFAQDALPTEQWRGALLYDKTRWHACTPYLNAVENQVKREQRRRK